MRNQSYIYLYTLNAALTIADIVHVSYKRLCSTVSQLYSDREPLR